MRARRALPLFKDVPLRTRRVLLPWILYSNSTLLVVNKTSLNIDSALLALNWRHIERFDVYEDKVKVRTVWRRAHAYMNEYNRKSFLEYTTVTLVTMTQASRRSIGSDVKRKSRCFSWKIEKNKSIQSLLLPFSWLPPRNTRRQKWDLIKKYIYI